LTHNFVIGSKVWFYSNSYKIRKSMWDQVSDLFIHRAYVISW
jgi:hypothetical protein